MQGTTYDAINQEMRLLKLNYHGTKNKNEQQKIASVLSDVDLSNSKISIIYKSKLETLKKGLMQKLLTGQIRVKA